MFPFAKFLSVMLLLLAMAVEETASLLGSGPHIADVNILLPPKMTNYVEYRLQGSDGCFKWSWDHHDILSVLPEHNSSSHCSTSARLKSIAPYSGRKETAVYATDVHSGVVIRCKVFIDIFSRIQIFHHSVKLDLEGLATLRVRAFDTEDNVFTSLVGLRFTWQLIPETDGSHHLVHVPLKDSPLSDCGGLCGDLDVQIMLENSGVYSDLFVVKGAEIGHEKVSVHLLEPDFMYMTDKIVLTVAEAMSLEPPSPVCILIGAAFQYSLKVIRGNIPQVVTLPSLHHRWSVTNSTIAQVDTLAGETRGVSLGETAITVEDTRVAGHIQVSTLIVVLPDTISLYISPLSSFGDPVEGLEAIPSIACWYVVSGRQYLIQMKVFTQGPGAHEIYITEKDDVKMEDDVQYECWKTFLVSGGAMLKYGGKNSRILKTASEGMGRLIASLTYYSGHQDSKEVLKVVQEIMVCDKVMLILGQMIDTSQIILLPWAPGIYQEVELNVTGGCAKASSDYKWFSSDMATASVSTSGTIQAKKPGKTTIKVVSAFDPLNYDEVVVEVSTPSAMVMLQNFHVETVVESHLEAAVTLKTDNGGYFYKCDAFSSLVNWKSGSKSFTVVNNTGKIPSSEYLETIQQRMSFVGPPCSWVNVYASGPGQTILHATLPKESSHLDVSFVGPSSLRATQRIAAYLPLIVQQAGDGSSFGGYWFKMGQVESSNHLQNLNKLYLAPGTNMEVSVVGGPEPWDDGVDYIDTFEISNGKHSHSKDGIHIHLISGSTGGLYKILCRQLGTYNLVFKRGNSVGDDHPIPSISEVLLSLKCRFPSSIALLVDEPVNKQEAIQIAKQADQIPGQGRFTPVTVANGQTIRIAAVGISDTGEAFANSSSLCLGWELSSCEGLAYLDDAYGSERSKSSWERFLVLHNESGLCVVRASVSGFCDALRGDYYAQLHKVSFNVLTDAVRLQIVSTLRVIPEFILMFFSPDSKVNISISGGSCSLETGVNNSRVVEVIQSPHGLQCSQLILSAKGLGTALVTVYDIGLTPPRTASALVQVADVDWIKIASGEEISLMEGGSQTIDLMAGIDDGSTFDSSQIAYMDIHVHIERDIVELVDDGVSTRDGGYASSSSFKIFGKELGITTLYVSIRQQSGQEIVSQQIKIEVYAPPRIKPDEIFLVPGASYVLTLTGGPTIGIYVEYTSTDDEIARVHKSSGQLLAISPGHTTLLATVFGNGDVVICKTHGNVKVGFPSSVSLNVQSEQLAVGREMPIYPLFSEGNLFSFYELCKIYNWTIEDEEVLSFRLGDNHQDPPITLGDVQPISYLDDKEGYIRVLYGRSAGKTNVAAAFSCDFISGSHLHSRSYSASISLSVVPDLPLALGVPITWVLPSHYTTSKLLPFVESLGQWDSQSHKGSITYSLLKHCGGKNEPITKDDISIDGNRIRTGESNNLACIQAKDRSTGRIEVASCVRVAEVAQIRIGHKEFPILLAVGAETEIPINYFDALGNPFHEAYNTVFSHAETNHRDIVSIDDTHFGSGKLHLKALRHGKALVKVSINNNPRKSDYVLISVGAHVYPQDPILHVGSGLDFTVQGLNGLLSGHWLSGNESVLSIDRLSGKAEAVGIGSTRVFFESTSMKLQTAVTVQSRTVVTVNAPKETLTNFPYPRGYGFSVSFSNTQKKFAAIENKGVSYDCKVDPPFVGYAQPWMDPDTSNCYCLFYPYSPEHLVRSLQKSKNTTPYLSISINCSLTGSDYVSGSASALFVGGFSIPELDKNSMQLNLSLVSYRTILTIAGNTGVEIHWNKENLMRIKLLSHEGSGVNGFARYEVEAGGNDPFKDKITITLPATGQRAEIDVNYVPGDQQPISPVLLYTGIIAAIIAGISTIFSVLKSPNVSLSPTPRPPSSSATPTRTALLTPERSSTPASAHSSEHSPQTPQPFVDYVRRTIDETPYYRREPRRRFNPQNTL